MGKKRHKREEKEEEMELSLAIDDEYKRIQQLYRGTLKIVGSTRTSCFEPFASTVKCFQVDNGENMLLFFSCLWWRGGAQSRRNGWMWKEIVTICDAKKMAWNCKIYSGRATKIVTKNGEEEEENCIFALLKKPETISFDSYRNAKLWKERRVHMFLSLSLSLCFCTFEWMRLRVRRRRHKMQQKWCHCCDEQKRFASHTEWIIGILSIDRLAHTTEAVSPSRNEQSNGLVPLTWCHKLNKPLVNWMLATPSQLDPRTHNTHNLARTQSRCVIEKH